MLDYGLLVAVGVFALVGVLSYLAGRSEQNLWQTCVDRVSCMWRQRNINDGQGWDR
jgi:uncharacterized protein (UPF0333 family)